MAKVNPKTVGGFVVGAVILAVAAVSVFGSGKFFEQRDEVVAFFSGSLMGLRVGAPVEMRGVKIGTVTDLWVEVHAETLEFTFPVLMQIEIGKVRGLTEAEARERSRLPEMIENGLRAQLVTQSMVTGQQSVQIVLQPNSPVNVIETNLQYDQIPTVPSLMEEIETDVGQLVDRAGALLLRVNEVLSEDNRDNIGQILTNLAKLTGDMDQGVVNLNELLANANAVVKDVRHNDPDVQQVLEAGHTTLQSYKALADRAEGILATNEEEISNAVADLRQMEKKLSSLVDTTKATLEENRKGMKDFTAAGLYELTNLSIDAQGAVESFRRLVEEMERDPARFFFGKAGEREVQ